MVLLLLIIMLLFMFRVCHGFLSDYCSLLDLPDGSLVCNVLLRFCHFSVWCPGSGVLFDCIDS